MNTTPITTTSAQREWPSATSAVTAITISGQRQERVDDAADDLVDEAAEVAHHEADARPGDDAEQRRERRDHQRGARTGEHAREDVAAELVGAEQMAGARAPVRMSAVCSSGSCGVMAEPMIAQKTHHSDDHHADR